MIVGGGMIDTTVTTATGGGDDSAREKSEGGSLHGAHGMRFQCVPLLFFQSLSK